MYSAIILAAGESSRMGEFKPLLPLDKESIIERVIRLFHSVGIAQPLVVMGHRSQEIAERLAPHQGLQIFNTEYTSGMLSSVKAGINGLPKNCDAFFIHPVDIPLIRRRTLLDLLNAYRAGAGSILHPVFLGTRGHPVLISGTFIESILDWNGAGGLKTFLAQHDDQAVNVPVADESILFDVDTPEQYQRVLKKLRNQAIPSVAECRALMEIYDVPPPLNKHCQAVARIALELGRVLNHVGCELDLDMIYSSAFVHDLARQAPDHAKEGARLLNEREFPKVAEIVAVHMDITVDENSPVDEKEIVYLADKLVIDDRPVDLGLQFETKMVKYGRDSQAAVAIQQRRENAMRIKDRVERAAGLSLGKILENLPDPNTDGIK